MKDFGQPHTIKKKNRTNFSHTNSTNPREPTSIKQSKVTAIYESQSNSTLTFRKLSFQKLGKTKSNKCYIPKNIL